jgi:hypothetical protein
MGTRIFLAAVIALLCLGLLGLWYWDTPRSYRLLIAAGQRSGQAFQIAEALRQGLPTPRGKLEVVGGGSLGREIASARIRHGVEGDAGRELCTIGRGRSAET